LIDNAQNSVKIADFGLGEILSQFLDPKDFVGTIRYTSPERIDCGMCDEYAGDICSFGLSILEIYPGRFPIEVETRDYLTRLVFAICMSAPPEAPPSASTEFRYFITCCLQREPERRWECSAVVATPFYTAEPGESVKIASKNKNSSNNVLLLFHPVTSIISNLFHQIYSAITWCSCL
jgi:mitogen-activated protein kinase kinase 4/5